MHRTVQAQAKKMKFGSFSVLLVALIASVCAVFDDEAFSVDWEARQIGDFSTGNAFLQGEFVNILSEKGILTGVKEGEINWRVQLKGVNANTSQIVHCSYCHGFIAALNYEQSSTVSLWRSNGSLLRTIAEFEGKQIASAALLPTEDAPIVIIALSSGELIVSDFDGKVVQTFEIQQFDDLKISTFENGNAILLFQEHNTQNAHYLFYDNTKQIAVTHALPVGYDEITDFHGSRVIFNTNKYHALIINKVTGVPSQPISLPAGEFISIPSDDFFTVSNEKSIDVFTVDGTHQFKIPFVSDFKLDFVNDYFVLYTNSEITIIYGYDSGKEWERLPVTLDISEIKSVKSYTNGLDGLFSVIFYRNGSFTEMIDGEVKGSQNGYLGDVISHTVVDVQSEKDITDELLLEEELNLLSAYIYRAQRHFSELKDAYEAFWDFLPKYFTGEYIAADSSNLKYFGFEKLLVLGTSKNLIVAFDTLTGEKVWSARSGADISTLDNDGEHIFVFTTSGVLTFDSKGELKGESESDKTPAPKTDQSNNVIQGVSQLDETTWTFRVGPNEEILGAASKDPEDPIASVGIVLGNRDVLYKYLYPHQRAIGIINKETNALTVNLLDSVTGEVLYSTTHDEIVHSDEPFNIIVGEHWVIYSYYSEKPTPEQKIVVLDLFESLKPSERLSSQSESSPFEARSPPVVLARSFVIPYKIKSLALSRTKFGATTKSVILALENGQIVYLPKFILNSRRIDHSRPPTEDEKQEFMLLPYDPVILIDDSKLVISHTRQVLGVEKIVSIPTQMESTSIICAFGLDIFCTRISPSGQFDKLTPSFEKFKLIGSILLLVAIVAVLKPLNDTKKLKAAWVQELA